MQATSEATRTAASLPWNALLDEIEALLRAGVAQVPPRIVMPTGEGSVLFVMPATDGVVAMTKLISFTAANAGSGRPTIQGDVSVFDVASGERRLILDGPTVTARRTAAVSALAARHLAARPDGATLIIGAGVQGRAHLEAYTAALGVRRFVLASRRLASAEALARHARTLGLQAQAVADAHAALAHCPLVVTCTPANAVVLSGPLRADAFVAAVGAFTPQMRELDAGLCRHFAEHGRIVVDTRDAEHEAGDLLQAGIAVAPLPSLQDVLRGPAPLRGGAVLFKSCGWAGWDLAAARLALRHAR
ncbi:delta(1)-pyrroline-2-carboxylate reductase family protein [Comamonas sp. NLF-1-9]|uniref:delta(1)-pyrroline-2-carboxylate reductase family protein n=1 Tax=Comamonas sp. NLF-1-9 TaxID=2853163 RepID=UPI001C48C159|nr:delta(1)-pyrroline-2-carboxylate reductase family protein [Comamonas sp. NLF-1-9]QXL85630.1 delta(1)-pyrroline-2-carboxylate reductase family protein [Comamonas sp. NLF-1-9]